MAFRSVWLRRWMVCALVVVGACLWPLPSLADGSRAGVIIVDGTGAAPTTVCVTFAEKEITGIDLLRRAQPDLVTQVSIAGEAVCKIGPTGCTYPAEECFCACRGAECLYWSYWYREGNRWVYSARGANSRIVRHGDLDAWVWGNGQTMPPNLVWEDVCSNSPLAAQGVQNPSPLNTPPPAQGEPYPGLTETPVKTPTPSPNPNGAYPGPEPTHTATAAPTEALPQRPTATVRPSNTPQEPTPTQPERPTNTPAPTALPNRPTPAAAWATTAPVTLTPLPEPTGSSTPPSAEGGAGALTATPDIVANKIREGVAQARAAAQARSASPAPHREYGAFAALAIILGAVAGTLALRRRRRAAAALYPPQPTGAPESERPEEPPPQDQGA